MKVIGLNKLKAKLIAKDESAQKLRDSEDKAEIKRLQDYWSCYEGKEYYFCMENSDGNSRWNTYIKVTNIKVNKKPFMRYNVMTCDYIIIDKSKVTKHKNTQPYWSSDSSLNRTLLLKEKFDEKYNDLINNFNKDLKLKKVDEINVDNLDNYQKYFVSNTEQFEKVNNECYGKYFKLVIDNSEDSDYVNILGYVKFTRPILNSDFGRGVCIYLNGDRGFKSNNDLVITETIFTHYDRVEISEKEFLEQYNKLIKEIN